MAKVLVVVQGGVATAYTDNDSTEVLVLDLDLQDEEELAEQQAKFTGEWREAFPEFLGLE